VFSQAVRRVKNWRNKILLQNITKVQISTTSKRHVVRKENIHSAERIFMRGDRTYLHKYIWVVSNISRHLLLVLTNSHTYTHIHTHTQIYIYIYIYILFSPKLPHVPYELLGPPPVCGRSVTDF
jgi:hypothetical protein